ncbi:unnamed protein product [Calypogeia fissa]
MAKKFKNRREDSEIGSDGAAAALLSLRNIGMGEPSTAAGPDYGVGNVGLDVPEDDSDAGSPPELPDLHMPPLKTKKRKSIETVDAGLGGEETEDMTNKKGKSSSDTVDAGPSSVGKEDKTSEQGKSNSDTVDAGHNVVEENKEKKKKKKRKDSSYTFDAGLNCEEGKENKQNSSGETVDAGVDVVEENKKKKKKRKDSSDTFDAGRNGKEGKEKENSSSATVDGGRNVVEEDKEKKKRKDNSDTFDAGLNGEEEQENKQGSTSDAVDAGLNIEEKHGKKKKKRKDSIDTLDAGLNGEEIKEDKQNSCSDTVEAWLSSFEEQEKRKKRIVVSVADGRLVAEEICEKKKKKKTKKEKSNDVRLENGSGGVSNGEVVADDGEVKQELSRGLPEEGSGAVMKKKRKRNRASDDTGSDVVAHRNPVGNIESNEGIVEIDGAVGESRRKKTVRFQEPANNAPVEIVTYMPRRNVEDDMVYFSEDRNWKKDITRQDLLYGKFTKEEDEKLKISVFDYIKMRGLGDEGLQIVLHSSQHKAIARGCWLEIAKCLPARPVKQIHSRAMRILGGHKRGKWSPEELELLTNLQKLHGNNWIKIASHLDRSADVCKDKWRHVKLIPTRKAGTWQQDELDKLCKLVRRSLKIKGAIPSKGLDRREVRDDISWEWIAEQLQRDCSRCADVWYNKLASPMISANKWANGDDRLLLQRLMELGAASEEAVDWESILDHREGDHCAGRWKEMTRPLGRSDHVSFEDKLELLAKRYAPDLVGIEEEI